MASALTITSLEFVSGAAPDTSPLVVEPATVVVLVGPNNSGKSLALREIETWCLAQHIDQRVIRDVGIALPEGREEVTDLLQRFEVPVPPGHSQAEGHVFVSQHTFRAQDPIALTRSILAS